MDSQDTNDGCEDSWRWGRCEDRSPLQVVWSAFDRMTSEPVLREPVCTGSWPVPGMVVTSWGELREQLLDPSCSFRRVDAVWRWLIERARHRWSDRGGEAVLACAGLAVPMLVELAGRFTASDSGQRPELESEILAGFLDQLRVIDLDAPYLWSRLWSAMAHLCRSWARAQAMTPRPADLGDDVAALPTHPAPIRAAHPELVLADAVAEGVITAEAAELIALTRWEQRSLTSVAHRHRGTGSHWKLRKQRQRAEHALVPWLTERLADPDPAPAGTPDAVERGPAPADPGAGQQEVRRCA